MATSCNNSFFVYFWRARVCWPLLCFCRPFCSFLEIRTQRAAVGSRCASNFATHLPITWSWSPISKYSRFIPTPQAGYRQGKKYQYKYFSVFYWLFNSFYIHEICKCYGGETLLNEPYFRFTFKKQESLQARFKKSIKYLPKLVYFTDHTGPQCVQLFVTSQMITKWVNTLRKKDHRNFSS